MILSIKNKEKGTDREGQVSFILVKVMKEGPFEELPFE